VRTKLLRRTDFSVDTLQGLKHLIQCHCVLPQFKNVEDPVFHKFVAFSVVDDSDTVQPKFAQCNNCGVIHKITDICRSELTNKEDAKFLPSIEDIKFSIPDDLCRVLESYQSDIATWEQAEWIYLTKSWDQWITLARDEADDGDVHGKRLIFTSEGKFRIEAF
jgi:hypothetical protein